MMDRASLQLFWAQCFQGTGQPWCGSTFGALDSPHSSALPPGIGWPPVAVYHDSGRGLGGGHQEEAPSLNRFDVALSSKLLPLRYKDLKVKQVMDSHFFFLSQILAPSFMSIQVWKHRGFGGGSLRLEAWIQLPPVSHADDFGKLGWFEPKAMSKPRAEIIARGGGGVFPGPSWTLLLCVSLGTPYPCLAPSHLPGSAVTSLERTPCHPW